MWPGLVFRPTVSSEDEGQEEGDGLEDDEDDNEDEDEGTEDVSDEDEDEGKDDEEASDISESDSDDCNRCAICLFSFQENDVGTPESCDHVFCLDCIQEWAKVSEACLWVLLWS